MTNWADPNTVADKAAGWSEAQVTCRLNRHAWPGLSHRMTVVSHGRGYYEVVQDCIRRCGVRRKTTLNERGYQTEAWAMDYSGAKGYLMADDDGRPLGRIDSDGRAKVWLTALQGVAVREVSDE